MEAIRSYFTGTGRFKYLLAALIALVISDGLITNFLVQGCLAREANPFLQTIVGGSDFIVIKAAGALFCALILHDIHKHWRALALVSSACFVAVYTGIVVWNLSLFFIS